jgi:hypothetical protein
MNPQELGYLLAVIGLTIIFFGPLALIVKFRRTQAIRARMYPLMMYSIVTGYFSMLNSTIQLDIIKAGISYPCLIRIIITNMAIPMWLYSFIFRQLYLIALNAIYQARLKASTKLEKFKFHPVELLALRLFAQQGKADKTRKEGQSALISHTKTSASVRSFTKEEVFSVSVELTNGALIRITAVILILEVILTLASVFNSYNNLLSNKCNFNDLWIFNGHRAVLMAISLILLFYMRKINDALQIQKELIASVIIFNVIFYIYLASNYSPLTSPLRFQGASFATIFSYSLCHLITCCLPLYQAIKETRRNRNIEMNNAAFDSVLRDPDQFEKLKEIAASEFTVENVMFYEKYMLAIKDENTNEKHALYFFNNFINPKAPFLLNISGKLAREAINMNNWAGVELVAKEVYNMIYLNTFRRMVAQQRHTA